VSTPEDVELSRALDALVARKAREQHRSWAWFALALASTVLAIAAHHHLWALLGALVVAAFSLQAGARAHLRADALRSEAMSRILAEALRRSAHEYER
jgi:hypothetical protein